MEKKKRKVDNICAHKFYSFTYIFICYIFYLPTKNYLSWSNPAGVVYIKKATKNIH